MKKLQAPLDETTARSLHAGEAVILSGVIVTARDKAHIRALSKSSSGEKVPELQGATVYHCGPIIRERNGHEAVAAGPTTSARMNMMGPRAVRELGIKGVIGKGGMSKETHDAMQECGCVYLAATGGAAVTLAEGIREVRSRSWEDLGMAESVWELEVKDFGPLVVAMDSHGRSLYEETEARVRERMRLRAEGKL